MLGEIVAWKEGDKDRKGIVYIYMPNGDLNGSEPYIKVRSLRPWGSFNGVAQHAIHKVSLADPSLQVLTLDREIGATLEEKYHAGKTANTEVRGEAPGSDDQEDCHQAEND